MERMFHSKEVAVVVVTFPSEGAGLVIMMMTVLMIALMTQYLLLNTAVNSLSLVIEAIYRTMTMYRPSLFFSFFLTNIHSTAPNVP